MKKTVKIVLPILLGVLIAVVLLGSLVTTRPNEYTIVKQFGKVVRVIDQPGLSLKTPFVQSTSTLPKTEMLYDLAASDVITSDKKSMVADSFVLWRIVDPLKFIQTLSGSVSGAEARLDQAIEKVLTRVKPQAESKVSIERIPVEKGGRKVLIPVDQIRYIMAKDDYSCIFTDDDRFLSTTSLAQFEAKLCDFGFFRVHRRYIVNLACVEDVETVPSGAIQLGITGMEERVPVSRRRVVPLKKALSL